MTRSCDGELLETGSHAAATPREAPRDSVPRESPIPPARAGSTTAAVGMPQERERHRTSHREQCSPSDWERMVYSEGSTKQGGAVTSSLETRDCWRHRDWNLI